LQNCACSEKKVGSKWPWVFLNHYLELRGHYSSLRKRKIKTFGTNLVKFSDYDRIFTRCYRIALFCYKIDLVGIPRVKRGGFKVGKGR